MGKNLITAREFYYTVFIKGSYSERQFFEASFDLFSEESHKICRIETEDGGYGYAYLASQGQDEKADELLNFLLSKVNGAITESVDKFSNDFKKIYFKRQLGEQDVSVNNQKLYAFFFTNLINDIYKYFKSREHGVDISNWEVKKYMENYQRTREDVAENPKKIIYFPYSNDISYSAHLNFLIKNSSEPIVSKSLEDCFIVGLNRKSYASEIFGCNMDERGNLLFKGKLIFINNPVYQVLVSYLWTYYAYLFAMDDECSFIRKQHSKMLKLISVTGQNQNKDTFYKNLDEHLDSAANHTESYQLLYSMLKDLNDGWERDIDFNDKMAFQFLSSDYYDFLNPNIDIELLKQTHVMNTAENSLFLERFILYHEISHYLLEHDSVNRQREIKINFISQMPKKYKLWSYDFLDLNDFQKEELQADSLSLLLLHDLMQNDLENHHQQKEFIDATLLVISILEQGVKNSNDKSINFAYHPSIYLRYIQIILVLNYLFEKINVGMLDNIIWFNRALLLQEISTKTKQDKLYKRLGNLTYTWYRVLLDSIEKEGELTKNDFDELLTKVLQFTQ